MAGGHGLATAGANSGAGVDHVNNTHADKTCSYTALVSDKFYEYVAVIEMLHLLATDENARKAVFNSIDQSDFMQWQRKRNETLGHTYEFLKERWFGDPNKAEEARERAKESLEGWDTHRAAFLNSLKDALFSYYNEIKKRYKECGVAFAFASVSVDGAFTLGELAIGAGAVAGASKIVKSLKFFVSHTSDGKVAIKVVNPKGGSFEKQFSHTELEGKYGKPQDNKTGVLKKNTNRSVNDKLSKDQYDKLRKTTPSEKVRKEVRSKYPNAIAENPVPDEWLPGLQRTAPVEADHIVSMKQITEMPGFSQLSFADQKDILNMSENFTGLSRSANASKGDLSFSEWTHHKATGTPVDPKLREQFMKKEEELKKKIQEEINKRKKKKEDNDNITFRDE
jgi:hypothetical protein